MFPKVLPTTFALLATSACGIVVKNSTVFRANSSANLAGPVVCKENISTFLQGSGTAESPYRMCSPEHFVELSEAPSYWDAHFVLYSDISFDDYYSNGGAEFQIGVCTKASSELCAEDSTQAFRGVLDGNGFELSGFQLNNASGEGQALFAQTDNAVITDIRIKIL